MPFFHGKGGAVSAGQTICVQSGLPQCILHTLTEIRAPAPTYDVENGGQWVAGTPERIDFEGCVLPVSEDDWKTAAEGTYTANSRKIYTNGHVLRIGGQVYDPQDSATYTVRGDLDHGVIHPLRRFVADRKGEAASK